MAIRPTKWFNPASLTWLFGHLTLILVGIICLVASEGPLWQSVGGSFVTTGIAGEVLFLYVILSDETRTRLSILTQAGIDDVFPVRSIAIRNEYDKRLKSAREIDIIGFGLSSLREDYSANFPEWSRMAKVRILLIDPDFPSPETSFAEQRNREEGSHDGKIQQDVRSFLETLEAADGIVAGRFEVRLLRMLPSINMFRINDEAFWGPYLALQQSRNTPTLLVRGGFLLQRFREHFDSLWSSAEFSVPAYPRVQQ